MTGLYNNKKKRIMEDTENDYEYSVRMTEELRSLEYNVSQISPNDVDYVDVWFKLASFLQRTHLKTYLMFPDDIDIRFRAYLSCVPLCMCCNALVMESLVLDVDVLCKKCDDIKQIAYIRDRRPVYVSNDSFAIVQTTLHRYFFSS